MGVKLEDIIAGLVATIIASVVALLWKKIHKRLVDQEDEPEPDDELAETPSGHPLYPDVVVEYPSGLSIAEKVDWLEKRHQALCAEARQTRETGGDYLPLQQQADELYACLCSMSFLAPQDVLDQQYVLHQCVGSGRFSVVWKAYDKHSDQLVAVKFIRYPYIRDESVVQRLKTATRLMAQCHTRRIAAVRKALSMVSLADSRKLVYYALEYVDGVSLGDYCRSNQQGNEAVIDGLLELGRCVEQAHDEGILHRDIKMENILVRPDGKIKLVDFDAVVPISDNPVYPGSGSGGSEYSAPEVLFESEKPDVRADVFSLGRVFAHVFYGRGFPNAYELNIADVIGAINTTPDVKRALKKATSVYRRSRYQSMKRFLDELERAVGESRETPPLFATVRQEKAKIKKVLYHAFLGTVALMLIARPIFTHFDMAQLSDRTVVALFQGVIGSLIWGYGITIAFLFYLIMLRRSDRQGYLSAMVVCGSGGFLAGLLVALLSVLVTNPTSLVELGWLKAQAIRDGLDVGILDRLSITIQETRMFFAFPLTGLLTGCGVGLCLNYGIAKLLSDNRLGTGVLPVPSKFDSAFSAGFSPTVKRLLLSWKAHLFLLFPVIFGYLIIFVLEPSSITEAWQEEKLCIGEGAIHYFGAVGLVSGFFHSVKAQ